MDTKRKNEKAGSILKLCVSNEKKKNKNENEITRKKYRHEEEINNTERTNSSQVF